MFSITPSYRRAEEEEEEMQRRSSARYQQPPHTDARKRSSTRRRRGRRRRCSVGGVLVLNTPRSYRLTYARRRSAEIQRRLGAECEEPPCHGQEGDGGGDSGGVVLGVQRPQVGARAQGRPGAARRVRGWLQRVPSRDEGENALATPWDAFKQERRSRNRCG